MQTTSLGALGVAAAPHSWIRNAAAQPAKPNIIWIMADDLGYGDLGCYGQEQIETPRLDRMAEEGIRFTQAYAGSTVCAPSRCVLMTGLHTGNCRIRGNLGRCPIEGVNVRLPLLPEDLTVAELLKEAGYTTGIVGKWGLGEPDTTGIPNRKGFDFWYGFLNQHRAHNYFPDYVWRNEERDYFERWTYVHNAFTDEALHFVRDNHDRPFFLYLPYTIPHAFNAGGANGMPIPSQGQYADRDWPSNQKNLAAMISLMDRDVGRLLDLLDELGIGENTLVFFTSDNGPHSEGGNDPDYFNSSGPLRGIKRALYDGGIRVPMIARWPRTVPAGVVSDHAWGFWDLLPTAADLAGVNTPYETDGVSIVETLKGGTQPVQEYMYWEFHERGFNQAALWQGRWKGVRLGGVDAPLELYDLDNDIGEQHNIADQHPEIVRRIEDYLARARTDSVYYPIS